MQRYALSCSLMVWATAGALGCGSSDDATASSGSTDTTGPGPATEATTTTGATQAVTEAATSEGDTGGATEGQTGGQTTTTGQASTSTGFDTGPTTGNVDPSTGPDPSTSTTTGEPIENCDDLKLAYMAELAEITQCTADEECGQELQGTSCGCTRNLVARLDADTTKLYELIDMAETLECELILAGTCDCPPADGFACNEGICTWNYI